MTNVESTRGEAMSRPSRRVVLQSSLVAGAAATASSVAGPAGAAAAVPRQPQNAPEDVPITWLGGGTPAVTTGSRFGVPWERGALSSVDRLALNTDGGDQVPVQNWPLAFWPDGSVKWSGHAVPANSGLAENLTLSRGRPAAPSSRARARTRPGNRLRNIPETVEVSTGVITLSIPTSGTTVLSSLKRGSREQAASGKLVLLLETPDEGEYAGSSIDSYTGEVSEVTIEQNGPVLVVVKVTGSYVNSDGRKTLPFTLRLELTAGSDAVQATHYFIFDGDQHTDFIRGLGLRWNVPMSDEMHNRHIRFVGEDSGIWGEAVRLLSPLRRDVGGSIKRQQFEGVATAPVSQWPSNVRGGIGDIPLWSDFKLVQLSADAFHIGKRTDADSAWLEHAGHGRRAKGVGWIGGATGGGIAFGMKDFWQRHPTQLDVRGAATDTATVTAWFWSPESPAMDLRNYSDERHGLSLLYEEPGRGFEDEVATPEGVARSNEITLWALAETPSREALVRLGDIVSEPPRLLPTPEYLAAVQPFGRWSLPNRDTPERAAVEDALDEFMEFFHGQVEQRRWYGFWHYGDIMHTYDDTRHEWRYDAGGFAWAQGELGPDQGMWYQFMRTGREDYFRFAEAMTLCVAEGAVHHDGLFAGLGSRHAVVKWGDGAKETRISASQMKRFYYYLTADERVGDYMRYTLRADETQLTVPPLREAFPDPSGDRYIVRFGPDWIAMASNWLTEWERTGNETYRDRIQRGLEDMSAMDLGMFTGNGGSVAFDPADGSLEDVGISQSPSNISLLFGGQQILYELYDVIDSPEFKQELLNFSVARTGTREERIEFYGRDFNAGAFEGSYASMMAFAGAELDNDSYKERAWQTFGRGWALRDPIEITGPDVLRPVEYRYWASSNDFGQRLMGIIQLLALAPDQVRAP
ncbi:Tat pathway signal sequence domain protein [Ruania suaedae]|uniref:exo-rhamnogalacturonan lyase family protein n=1 Tax=Ruania suaedae TaxID=2897774 RepID=UPI001E43EDBC|nr:Tat pathway signal sequence domain protein [Ruania suaedae]UFU03925.1 Tat pathway signal sequence domain protein [Ruania suaedae]